MPLHGTSICHNMSKLFVCLCVGRGDGGEGQVLGVLAKCISQYQTTHSELNFKLFQCPGKDDWLCYSGVLHLVVIKDS